MGSYAEVKVRPDSEFSATVLINVVFEKLHQAFVELKNQDIGISFPMVSPEKKFLGEVIRLHGPHDKLQALFSGKWLRGLGDYIECSAISTVPSNAKFCQVSRVQIKSNAERLRRRYLKRHPEASAEEMDQVFKKSQERALELPFLQVKSSSTGQRFCLFLKHVPTDENRTGGVFNTYGLSANATVPWF